MHTQFWWKKKPLKMNTWKTEKVKEGKHFDKCLVDAFGGYEIDRIG
jgi:hypothetical protein